MSAVTEATVHADEAVIPAADVRKWAQENDVAVGTRGRISQSVVEQYRAAHAA